MRVLWICNIVLPVIARVLSLPESNSGGWFVGLSEALVNSPDIELSVCFPLYNKRKLCTGTAQGICYYGFPKKSVDPGDYDSSVEPLLSEILIESRPDIIHIWGTEYPHTLAMVKACEKAGLLDKVAISIQGLCSVIAKHYYTELPERILKKYTLRDFLKQDNIKHQRKKFIKRGAFEIQALQNVKHIIGRTTWDKACTLQINSNLKYHFCNETLRDEFYKYQWNINECEWHSIFVSQGTYPIKGLHFLLEAMPEILKRYPDTHLYVAGINVTKHGTLADKLKMTSYGKYIRELILKYSLSNHVIFTGELDEKQMCKRFLKTHVFVSPSTIENESNSLSEAKILGTPCVASYVGGVTDRLEHGIDGFFYPANEPYMLAYYICQIFKDDDLALILSQNAREHAIKTHDKIINSERLIQIYKEILYE